MIFLYLALGFPVSFNFVDSSLLQDLQDDFCKVLLVIIIKESLLSKV